MVMSKLRLFLELIQCENIFSGTTSTILRQAVVLLDPLLSLNAPMGSKVARNEVAVERHICIKCTVYFA